MPLYTFNHCLFCYKEPGEGGAGPSTAAASVAENQQVNSISEICRRFCTLASRYFNLDPYHFNPERTLISKLMHNSERACEKCAMVLKSFNDIYSQWEYLQVQLDWRAKEILKIMMEADKEGSENRKCRQALERKLIAVESSMEDVDLFRNELKDSIKEKGTYPELSVKKDPTVCPKKEVSVEEDYDSDFVVIRVRVPKKKRGRKARSPGKKTVVKNEHDDKPSVQCNWKSQIGKTLTFSPTRSSPASARQSVETTEEVLPLTPKKRPRKNSVVSSPMSSASSDFIPIVVRTKKKKSKRSRIDKGGIEENGSLSLNNSMDISNNTVVLKNLKREVDTDYDSDEGY